MKIEEREKTLKGFILSGGAQTFALTHTISNCLYFSTLTHLLMKSHAVRAHPRLRLAEWAELSVLAPSCSSCFCSVEFFFPFWRSTMKITLVSVTMTIVLLNQVHADVQPQKNFDLKRVRGTSWRCVEEKVLLGCV